MADDGLDGLRKAAEAWQELGRSEAGRVAIADLVSRFGFTRQSLFDANQSLTAFREGQRSVVVHVGRMLDYTHKPEEEKS